MDHLNGMFTGQFSAELNATGSSSLHHGLINITTAGSVVQLPSISCREITIIAKESNIGIIYVGGQGCSAVSYGAKLKGDNSITLPVNNANLIYLDASVDGEGISYVAL
ncbi:hypothetical protein JCM10914A_10380 [Paenibacillus sp. JCM 10914]|uniref:hypothetical protein n=1 Tax=Paenibacillus sp. JCM 10914 TaxID=1236974 RepID=UPI00068F4544|nr:hypothetical protein [Paenibacillus sp. JCM 10914]